MVMGVLMHPLAEVALEVLVVSLLMVNLPEVGDTKEDTGSFPGLPLVVNLVLDQEKEDLDVVPEPI